MKNLHERLKELRTQNGYTMKALCDKTGMPLRTYQNYEAGIREPSLSAIVALAEVYNVTTDYLLGRAPQLDPMKLLIAQGDTSPEALVKQFASLPEEGQALMLAVVRALKETHEIRYAKKKPRTVWIKQHQNKAAAGFGYDLSDKDEWDDVEVIDNPKVGEADFAVEIDGDSMEPDYHNGDLALVKLDPDVPVGEVGLFVLEGKGYIKERGKKCLISINPDYDDIELDSSARCIGLVIGTTETV